MDRPNILLIVADRLAGTLFRDGPADWLHAPNLARLAAGARRFARTYAATPLGAPSRAALLTGCLPSSTGIYDDGCEFAAAQPTIVHRLRIAGYRTMLAGTMGFVGPDQHHGFEERLTPEIAPAGFDRTPDWRHPGPRGEGFPSLSALADAGPQAESEADAHDAAAAAAAAAAIRRGGEGRPWLLAVGLAAPQGYSGPARHAARYADSPHLEPNVAAVPHDELDAHSQRMMTALGHPALTPWPDRVASARLGYFAAISALDERVGEILAALGPEAADTLVIFTAARGEMLGERGLWFAMSLREGAVRVPLLVAGPGFEPGRTARPVSILDIAPTLAALTGIESRCDGIDLRDAERGPVPMEYLGIAVGDPMVGLVDGCWKYVACAGDPSQLFDLADDPGEAVNLARLAPGEASRMAAEIEARWDRDAIDRAVRASQSRRLLVARALAQGARLDWRHRPDPGPTLPG